MPVATVDPTVTEHKELKTAPPDGFVDLRPLPFGMKLERRSKATRMMMRMPNTPKGQKVEQSYEVESMDEMTIAYDFAYCIVDHNLTDVNGVKLDFTNKLTLKALDPRIGSEIERYITELNEDEDEESLEDFMRRSTMSSEEGTTSSETGGSVSPVTPSGEEATS